MKNTLGDLNNHLFLQLERLNDEDLDEDTLKKEILRSQAMTGLAGKIIDNAHLLLQSKKFVENTEVEDKTLPRCLNG